MPAPKAPKKVKPPKPPKDAAGMEKKSFFKKRAPGGPPATGPASVPEAPPIQPAAPPPPEPVGGTVGRNEAFGKKKPKVLKEPAERKFGGPEKNKHKPLFAFKKRPPKREAAVAPPPAPEAPGTAVPQSKKSFFGRKSNEARASRGPKIKKPKQPKEAKLKKTKEPKAKKQKQPKAPKPEKVRQPKQRKERKAGVSLSAKTSPVGLDLGRSSITAVRLRHQTSGSVLQQAALDAIPEGLIQEGEVRDVDGLATAIRDFWKRYKIHGRKVALGLANQKIVVRSLDFPLLDEKELRSAIEFQAQDYIPIPIDEAVFDYHVLGRFTDHDGVEKQKVLVVAAQKAMVMDFINAVKKARLQVAGVDLQAFALIRSQITRSFLDAGAPEGTAIAVANIASDVTNLVVDVAGEPQFTRIISFGGDDFTKAVQDQMGINYTEAEVLKMKIGLAPPSEADGQKPSPEPPAAAMALEANTVIITPEPPEAGGGSEAGPGAGSPFGPSGLSPEGEPGKTPEPTDIKSAAEEEKGLWPHGAVDSSTVETADVVHRALEITTEALADEIRRSLDYYMSQENSIPIGKLLVSGGGGMLPNLDLNLSQQFPFAVEFGNPLMRVMQNKSRLSDEELGLLAPRLAIAIGLALEDEG